MTEDLLRLRLTRTLPAVCWVGAIAWILFSIQWISFRLHLASLITLVAAVAALVAATFAVVVSAKSPRSDPSWLRTINLVIVAVVTVSAGLLLLTSVVTRGDMPDAILGAVLLWLFVHMPVYSFLPRNTSWQGVAVGTAVQWTVIAVFIARATRGVRTSWALALSAGMVLMVAAAMITAFLLLGFRTWFDTP